LLESSIVATLLKVLILFFDETKALILVGDKSEILREHHILLIREGKTKSVLSDY
jgi:hypothetical protein